MPIQTINPATGEVIKTYQEMLDADVDKILETSHQVFLKWRETTFTERAEKMFAVADVLMKHQEEYAELITREMGKPIAESLAEIQKCSLVCKHYAEHAEGYLHPRLIETEMQKSYVCYRPMGVIFAIMPWNFPFWQVFRFAAPNLMAGNAAVLSHAPISTGASLAIESAFLEAGFPEGLFRSLIINNEQAKKVIEHHSVSAVTLTGSDKAGQAVGAESAGSLKKVVLELGGSDPYVILKDADLDLAADMVVKSRMLNNGQVCIAAKRAIVVDEVYDQFQAKILDRMKDYHYGDPMKKETKLGPMARDDLRDQFAEQVNDTVSKGAALLMGGKKDEGAGFYYEPTVLGNIQKGMSAYTQELFGPAICLFKAKDESDAINIANDTKFGLGAAVFTNDIERGERIAETKLRAGTCVVNTFVASDPRLPFGGIKGSGYGRELSSEGIHEFVNIKTICVK